MQTPILTVDNLSVTIGGVRILHDVSFSLRQGEALAILGPNGAGKTVLFKALLGLIPSEGAIRWAEGTRIGYVPQMFHVKHSAPIVVLDFFLMLSRNFWRPSTIFIAKVHKLIASMGLDPSVLYQRIGQLSGGQTQRVLLAWALLEDPDVLLLDEPTAAVDAAFEDTIYAILRRIQTDRARTILLISHDHNEVYRNAENVLNLGRA